MKRTKRITALALTAIMTMTSVNTALAAKFTDVPESHWSYKAVESASEKGFVSGIGNGLYAPNRSVSNIEWFVMLTGAFKLSNFEPTPPQYSMPEDWWYDSAKYAYKSNWLGGTTIDAVTSWSNGTDFRDFMPKSVRESAINRYDMAQTIYNMVKSDTFEDQNWTLDDVDTTGVSSKIADYSKIPDKYKPAVEFCYSAGFIAGVDSKGTFDGTGLMTRSSAATVLMGLYKVKEGTWTAPDLSSPVVTTPVVTEPVTKPDTTTTAPSTRITAVKDMITIIPDTKTNEFDYEIKINNTTTKGTLSNGKEITRENIKAMLKELEEVFPTGTEWALSTSDKKSYLYGSYGYGLGGACNSFAYMTFDILFGITTKPTVTTDISKVKPGDLIELVDKNGEPVHWIVVADVEIVESTKFVNGKIEPATYRMITRAEGNAGSIVYWGTKLPMFIEETILTSYPNSKLYSAY